MTLIKKLDYILDLNFKKKTFFIISIIFFSTILEVVGISLVIPFFLAIFDINNYQLPYLKFINLEELGKNHIFTLTLFVLCIYFVKNFFLSLFSLLKSKYVWSLKKYLSEKLLKQYLFNEENFVQKKNSSILMNILTKEISYFVHLLINGLSFISEFLIIISIIFLMLIIETQIFIALLILILLFFFLIQFFSKQKIKDLANQRLEKDTDYLKKSIQIIDGIREIKIYNKSEYFLKNYEQTNKDIFSINWKLELFQELPKYWLEFIILSFILILVSILYTSNPENQNIIIILGLIGIAGARILPSANKLFQSFQKIKIFSPSCDAILYELKKINTDRVNKDDNKNPLKIINFEDEIKIENLKFGYEDKILFDNLNFNIKKKTLIGIYGANGSGKSTLLDLIFGFLKPHSGSINIDGKNINHNLINWQQIIGYIPQNIYLNDSSILENITFSNTLETIDQKFLNEILTQVGLNQMIENLPDGIFTQVGERGSKISGGQKQRIGLARALFSKPKILVMDEATNSLDSDTTNSIINLVVKMKDITRIIVSHDIEVLQKCEKNYRLLNGILLEAKL